MTNHNSTKPVTNDPLVFFDQSETGRLACSLDWSKHALGPAAAWPPELKTILAMLFRNAHPMFLFWGDDLTCFYNDAYRPSFGIGKHPQAMGQKAIECWPEIWSIIYPQIEKARNQGLSSWNENQMVPVLRNGKLEEVYWTYSYSPVPLLSGEIGGILVTVNETTQSILAERELKASQERLSLALASAERANQIKSAFLANMSHEIRTPLGVILGFTDLLRDTNVNSEERQQFLDTISRNGKALTRIIDDILDLTKIEANKLELETVEFSFFDLLDEVTTVFKERAKSKGLYLLLNVSPDVPQKISSDPARLRQILINIIGNAVKFTSEGGVSIAVNAKQMGAHYTIKIDVTDTGIGLTNEQIDRLFEPFTQADNNLNRRYGGTGLGLVLARKLVRAFGGDIRIDQSSAKGSTFSIVFPTGSPHSLFTKDEHEGSQSVSCQSSIRGLRILLADDAIDNQMLVKRVLEHEGVKVHLVSNGEDAVKHCLNQEFDAVLMDIQMPVMDGYEAVRQLRAAGFTKPIIALTAHALSEDRKRTEAVGCDNHLTKPINFKELLDVLENVSRINCPT